MFLNYGSRRGRNVNEHKICRVSGQGQVNLKVSPFEGAKEGRFLCLRLNLLRVSCVSCLTPTSRFILDDQFSSVWPNQLLVSFSPCFFFLSSYFKVVRVNLAISFWHKKLDSFFFRFQTLRLWMNVSREK